MRARAAAIFALLAASSATVSCARGEPPTPAIDGAVSPLPPPPGMAAPTSAITVAAPPSSDGGGTAGTGGAGGTGGAAGAVATAEDAGPPVAAGPDPGTLPQTKDKPDSKAATFVARGDALWAAIVADDPDKAMPAFFPVTAYEQVKAIANPAGDWKRRLVANFVRDVHALHKRLGEHAADAKLLRFEVPDDRARWIEPGEEGNRLGYYRVYGTRIVYQGRDGDKERTIDVTSLISWRGEWYVVHLTGFK